MNLRHATVIVALAWFSGTVILPAEEPAREFPEKIIFQHSFPDGSGKDAASGILIRTVPAGIPANAVRSGTARKMLRIDSSKAFREGAQKVSLVFTGLPLLEYPAPRYEFSARFQGEKGRKASLFLESYDQDNKHLWFRKDIDLTGEPQTAGLTVSFPPGARKVYLQIDIPYAGEFFLSQAAFLQKSSSRGPRELLFHHTFDNGAGADYAKGDGRPIRAERLEFADGLFGKALRINHRNRGALEFALANNMRPERGTISLWFKPEWDCPVDFASPADEWRQLVMTEQPDPRAGSGAIWFWAYGGFLRGDLSDKKDRYVFSFSPIRNRNWNHLCMTWDEEHGQKIYMNAKSLASPGDEHSPLVRRPQVPQFDRVPLKSLFIGNHHGRQQADGLIDEVKIFSYELSPEEIRRESDRRLTFDLEVRKRYFSPDAPLIADFELTARAPLSQVKWQILNSAGETAASGESPDRLRQGEKLHLSETSSRKSTAGETYTLRVTAGGMTEEEPLFAFRRENPFLTETQEAPQEILRILPDPDLGDSRFASIGETVRKRCDGKPYLEAGKKRGDRFAVRLRLPKAPAIYFLEFDYPDDAVRTCDVIVQNSASHLATFNVGYCSGDEYRNTGKMLTQRNVFFALSDDVTAIFMTAREGLPAAAGEIRIYEPKDGKLPISPDRPAPAVNGQTRNVVLYFEDPAVNSAFETAASRMPGFENMLDKLVAYMKYSGQNMLAYPLVWYQGYIDGEYNPRMHADTFLDGFLEKFDRAGLQFMGTVNQHNLKACPVKSVPAEQQSDGSLLSSPFSILASGRPNTGWHGTPPNYNILHPAVQAEFFADLRRILETGAKHPSFKGIVMHLSLHSLHSFGSLEAGYNDYAVEAFSRDTGIAVPVNREAPTRGKLYAEWILKNARQSWIRWRCGKLAAFYRKVDSMVRQARPDLRLVLLPMEGSNLYGNADYTDRDFAQKQLAEMGLDLHCFSGTRIITGQTVFPADHRFYSDRKMSPERRKRLREFFDTRECYNFMMNPGHSWLHMHDRYWESAIGSTFQNHWSDKPNRLKASWLNEKPWRASTLNPAGFHAMKHYVLPLRYADYMNVSKGGYLIGTYGMDTALAAFSRAFRSLPALPFREQPLNSETVKLRTLSFQGDTWFYAVNTDDRPACAELRFDAAAAEDTASGRKLPSPLRLELAPYQLRTFRIKGGATLTGQVR